MTSINTSGVGVSQVARSSQFELSRTRLDQQQAAVDRVKETRRIAGLARDAREQIASLEQAFQGVHTRRTGSVSSYAQSAADLGLGNTPATFASLQSSEEVNASPTSFGPFAPAWTGSSTAGAIIDGEYNGDQGTDTLTFKSRSNGVHGLNNLKIEVRDSGGSKLDTLNIKASHPLDRVYTLSNGLELTLDVGALFKNDTFTLDVYDNVGSVADPTRAFDGTGNADPNLQHGLGVSAGSFDVNGVNISVGASDSIDDVLARITASAAGVTATYDSVSERIMLDQQSAGAANGIVFANDTSGFLSATKLAGAAVVPGTDERDDYSVNVLSEVAAFAGVTSGSILVNGTEVAIDVDTDTLEAVLTRINEADAGVDATLQNGQRVRLDPSSAGADMSLDDNGTGFLAAAGIDDGLYTATPGRSGPSDRTLQALSAALAEASQSINTFFNAAGASSSTAPLLKEVKHEAQQALNGHLSDLSANHGLTLDVRLNLTTDAATGQQDTNRASVKSHFRELSQVLLGSSPGGGGGGYLADLDSVLAQAMRSLGGSHLGLLVDIFI